MTSDENKLQLELYKELGLEVRQYNSEVYATNRLMLPPLIIGLLVLYGKFEKFLGVDINNSEAVHQLVWFGCVIISLIWIFNVSRLAQLGHLHRETIRQCECKLGIKGHRKIAAIDKNSSISKIVRHNMLRFIGFGIYFALLLFKLKSINFLALLKSIGCCEVVSILVSGGVSFGIWYFYFKKPFRGISKEDAK